MRSSDPELRLLHVHAHPDDESSKGAASSARYAAAGVRVMVACCTGGERGDVLNPHLDAAALEPRLAQVRAEEFATATRILGVETTLLGFVDSGFPSGDPIPPLPDGCFASLDPEVAAAPLVRLIREFRPQVMTTYDESGGYPHPDHIQCHRVALAAFRQAADPGVHPEFGPTWQVPKLYYQVSFTRGRFEALDAAMTAAGLAAPYTQRLDDPDYTEPDVRVTTRVECGDYFPVRDAALRAHATQVDPDGFWFICPLEIQQQAWPTEEFQLVYSAVPIQLPEDDLFAGLRTAPDGASADSAAPVGTHPVAAGPGWLI